MIRFRAQPDPAGTVSFRVLSLPASLSQSYSTATLLGQSPRTRVPPEDRHRT